MKLDQDILAAAKRIQELRKAGKLKGVKVIELHCNDDQILVVQFTPPNQRLKLTTVRDS